MEDNQQPGQLIVPHSPEGAPSPKSAFPEPQRPSEEPTSNPVPTPTPPPESAAPAVVQPQAVSSTAIEPAQQADNGWQFRQEAAPEAQTLALPDEVNWQTPEFINQKSFAWYLTIALSGAAIAAVLFLVTKDKFTAAIVLLAFISFVVFASHKPKAQQYSLNTHGIQIGVKAYGYQEFKAFSIIDEGSAAGIVLMPLRRFMPLLTVYVGSDKEDQVVDYLSAFLPFEHARADAFDNLLRRIHF